MNYDINTFIAGEDKEKVIRWASGQLPQLGPKSIPDIVLPMTVGQVARLSEFAATHICKASRVSGSGLAFDNHLRRSLQDCFLYQQSYGSMRIHGERGTNA